MTPTIKTPSVGPANGLTTNGRVYTASDIERLRRLDPSDPEVFERMPTHLDLPESDGEAVPNFQEHPQSILLTDAIGPVLRLAAEFGVDPAGASVRAELDRVFSRHAARRGDRLQGRDQRPRPHGHVRLFEQE